MRLSERRRERAKNVVQHLENEKGRRRPANLARFWEIQTGIIHRRTRMADERRTRGLGKERSIGTTLWSDRFWCISSEDAQDNKEIEGEIKWAIPTRTTDPRLSPLK